MDEGLELKELSNAYYLMNLCFLGIIIISIIYVVGFRLLFKLDKAGYIILST